MFDVFAFISYEDVAALWEYLCKYYKVTRDELDQIDLYETDTKIRAVPVPARKQRYKRLRQVKWHNLQKVKEKLQLSMQDLVVLTLCLKKGREGVIKRYVTIKKFEADALPDKAKYHILVQHEHHICINHYQHIKDSLEIAAGKFYNCKEYYEDIYKEYLARVQQLLDAIMKPMAIELPMDIIRYIAQY